VYGWRLESALLRALESDWKTPDEGIWEVRGPSRHFTHSKVMAWVAFDRAVKAVESFGCEGPVDRWRALRDEVHAEVCARGFDAELGAFVDGLPQGEGAFLACSFWLVDCLALLGRMDDARALFQRLLSIRNDVGLLSEEYDPDAKRLLGNFPQAFSHVSLVNSATNLTQNAGPSTLRPTT
jgi:GH15 family glucan-1,4-alpha-glucosidase